jgi:alkane 1-monooxygenase
MVSYLFAPLSLLVVAICVAFGSPAIWVAVVYIVLILAVLDRCSAVSRYSTMHADDPAWLGNLSLRISAATIVLIAILFIGLLTPDGIVGRSGARLGLDLAGARASLSGLEVGLTTIVVAIVFGTIANLVGHEFIHRETRPLAYHTGLLLEAFALDAEDAVGHSVHHSRVGTAADATTARRGEGFWGFLMRAIPGAAYQAFDAERERLAGEGTGPWSMRNRVVRGFVVEAGLLIAAFILGGSASFLGLLAAGILARLIVETQKYTSHYGLVRVAGTPFEARHSWNSDGSVTSEVLFRFGWHSGHHIHDDEPYWRIEQPANAPRHGLSPGAVVALVLIPPLWISTMAPHLAQWDQKHATPEERQLVEIAYRAEPLSSLSAGVQTPANSIQPPAYRSHSSFSTISAQSSRPRRLR